MNILWGDADKPELNKALAEWLSVQLGHATPPRDPYRCMGVFDGKDLVAALIFENYRPSWDSIEVSGAAVTPRWLTRQVISEIADFIFAKLGCQAAVMRCDADNGHVARILTAIGFESVLLPRVRGRHSDERVFILTDDGWANSRLNRKSEVSHGS